MSVEHLIAEWGLPALSVACLFEGDAVAFVGGLMAHRGLFPVAGAWAAITAGAMFIDNLLFHMGRHSARVPWMARIMGRPVAQRVMAAAGEHRIKIIIGFRFVWGTRTVTPPVLGAAGVPALMFLALDAVSVALWSALYVGLGYGLGLTIERLWGALSWGEHVAVSVTGAAALAVAVYWWWWRHRR